jgi:hypothetical protein
VEPGKLHYPGCDLAVCPVCRVEATAIAIATDSLDLDGLLRTSFHIEPGASVPAGTYHCEGCNTEMIVEAETKVGACGEHQEASKWRLQALAEP